MGKIGCLDHGIFNVETSREETDETIYLRMVLLVLLWTSSRLAMKTTGGKMKKISISCCVKSGFSRKSVNMVMGLVNR